MALPKYKTSRVSTYSCRVDWKAIAAATVSRPNCGTPALSHMTRSSCGNYRGCTYRSTTQSAHTK